MTKPKATPTSHSTDEFDFISGYFNMSSWEIPYFMTSMTLKQAAESLNLVSEYPGMETLDWDLEELYQRDVDWVRVKNDIHPYLRNEGKAQFFNALTVVLLPKINNEVVESYSSNQKWNAPSGDVNSNAEKVLNVGPVTFSYWDNWDDVHDSGSRMGRIQWNLQNTFSVALDGQHRLAAIKEYVESPVRPNVIYETRIPVILLVLSSKVGYKSPGNESIIKVMRNLFIDLNKKVEKVKRTRNIILDDSDPFSICVRAILSRRLEQGFSRIEETQPLLPLSLVDWHTDQAKFEDGPYITTILGLEWITKKLLHAEPIKDFMDYRAIKKQLSSFKQYLGIDLIDAANRLEEHKKWESPFNYRSDDELNENEIIRDAFRDTIGKRIVEVFENFMPYKSLLKLRTKVGADSIEFITWYYFKKRSEEEKGVPGKATEEFKKYCDRLKTREENKIADDDLMDALTSIEHEKGDQLAFKVVFQRSVFDALASLFTITNHEYDEMGEYEELKSLAGLLEEDTLEDDAQPEPESTSMEFTSKRTDELIQALNTLFSNEPDIYDVVHSYDDDMIQNTVYFWRGTLLSPNGTIDYSQSASGRAKDVLLIAVYLHIIKKTKDISKSLDSYSDLVDYLNTQSGNTIHRSLLRAISRFNSPSKGSAAERIVTTKDDYEEYDEAVANDETISRVRHLYRYL